MKLLSIAVLLLPAISFSQTPQQVKAHGLGVVPGAIVCHDLATVQVVFDLYTTAWEDRMQAIETQGQSTLINGKPLPPPRPERFGCALAKDGSDVTLVSLDKMGIAVVEFRPTPKGHLFKGVTQSNMISTH